MNTAPVISRKTSRKFLSENVKKLVINGVVRSMQVIGGAIGVALFLAMIYMTLLMIADYQEFLHKPIVVASEPSKESLKEAMQYHGTFYLERQDDGWWTFERDGKKCKALNDQPNH